MYTEEQMKLDLQSLHDREIAINERVDQLEPIHEDLIILERLDMALWKSFINLDPASDGVRRRTSFYGRIVKVSDIDTGDSIKDLKKSKLSRGDIVSFNPEAAYSLNVIDFEEIWCLSIENILDIDRGTQRWEKTEKHLRDRMEASMQTEKLKQESDLLIATRNTTIVDPNAPLKSVGTSIRVSGSDKDWQYKINERREQLMDEKKRR